MLRLRSKQILKKFIYLVLSQVLLVFRARSRPGWLSKAGLQLRSRALWSVVVNNIQVVVHIGKFY